MMTFTTRYFAVLIIGLLMSGCASSPASRFYVLNANLEQERSESENVDSIIGIRLVSIPEFMDRPQIVERVGDHEIRLAEYDRWAGDLDDNIERVLGSNLSALLPDARVITFPWRRVQRPETQISVVINRFDGKTGKDIVLEATWDVKRGDEDDRRVSRVYSGETDGKDYSALVSTMSSLLAELSQDIAASL